MIAYVRSYFDSASCWRVGAEDAKIAGWLEGREAAATIYATLVGIFSMLA